MSNFRVFDSQGELVAEPCLQPIPVPRPPGVYDWETEQAIPIYSYKPQHKTDPEKPLGFTRRPAVQAALLSLIVLVSACGETDATNDTPARVEEINPAVSAPTTEFVNGPPNSILDEAQFCTREQYELNGCPVDGPVLPRPLP